MARRTTPSPDPRDSEIRRLRNDLYVARMTVIDLVPEPARALLDAKYHCETIKDADAWEEWCIDGLLELADVRPGEEMGDYQGNERAFCPLCGGGAQTPYSRGFSVPTGLRRHLAGSHGSGRCLVLVAAVGMCMESIRSKSDRSPNSPNFDAVTDKRPVPPWEAPKVLPPPPAPNVFKLRR